MQYNFDNIIFSSGTNPTNSVGEYFKYYANRNNGVSLLNLQTQPRESITDLYDYLGSNYGFGTQQAFLGYQAFIIDPATNYNESSNRSYVSMVPSGGNYYQENYVNTNGYNGKLSFNASDNTKINFTLELILIHDLLITHKKLFSMKTTQIIYCPEYKDFNLTMI
jgi:hypothetical protein